LPLKRKYGILKNLGVFGYHSITVQEREQLSMYRSAFTRGNAGTSNIEQFGTRLVALFCSYHEEWYYQIG
jgi:hypothetical protein